MWVKNAMKNWRRKQRVDAELDEEVRGYAEMLAQEKIQGGVDQRRARREAKMEMGGIEQVKEQVREIRAGQLLEALWRDVRYGARMLRKNPGFAAVAVLTLALGIGATTGIFSVVNAVLIRSLPFRDPGRLVAIFQSPKKMKGLMGWAADGPDILDWQRDSRSVPEIAASLLDAANITGGRAAQHVDGERVTANYFDLLGVQAALGRTFSYTDGPAENREVLVSYSLWRSSFGGEDIVGRTIALDGQPFTVIGVMPAVFHDPRTWANPQSDYWIVLPQTQLAANRGEHMYACFGRLAPKVTLAQAQQEMDVIGANEAKTFPDSNDGMGVRVSALQQVNLQTFEEGHFESVAPAILLLQLAAAFLLLIACANVANLMLSQSFKRHREFAVRVAIGAGRGRIVRQLLTESILLSIFAGAAGALLAVWCINALLALAPKGYLPSTADIRVDLRVLMFTICVAALTGILFGLLPALRASRRSLGEDLKTSTSGAGGSPSRVGVRRAIIVFELAATFVLLAAGGLMVRSLASLLAVNPGFNPHDFFTAGLSLPAQQYAKPEQIARFFSSVQQRVEALPGVEAAAFTSAPEFAVTNSSNVIVEGHTASKNGAREVWPQICIITPHFFRAAGIPLLEGRDFSFSDLAADAKVTVVSESFAQHFWPHQRWLGKRISYGGDNQWRVVIGVAGDVRQEGLAAVPLPEAYFPLTREMADGQNAMNVVARSGTPASLLAREIGEQAASIDNGIPLSEVRSGQQLLDEWSGYLRYRATLLASFAVMALAIAAIGLFGAISYGTAQRTHEIGIRMALGAQRGDVFRLIILQGAVLALIGLAIGLGGALALTRFISSLLYGVTPYDWVTFAAVAGLLLVVALLACYIPARRAMRVDPMIALRYE